MYKNQVYFFILTQTIKIKNSRAEGASESPKCCRRERVFEVPQARGVSRLDWTIHNTFSIASPDRNLSGKFGALQGRKVLSPSAYWTTRTLRKSSQKRIVHPHENRDLSLSPVCVILHDYMETRLYTSKTSKHFSSRLR